MILNILDQSNNMQFMMKTRQDNAITNHKGLLHAKKEIELSWSI